jgi:quercetin 2,3-dioxygenase
MIVLRKSEDRGKANHGWLNSYHTFSFARYYDRDFMGFRNLRVINEDKIEGGNGFPTHSHDNMEIISYIISGTLSHKDSMGNTSTISAEEVQVMSAGTGVSHSEYNHSFSDITHLLQIWIEPQKLGLKPSYQQRQFSTQSKENTLKLIVSPDGKNDSLVIHQNVNIYASLLHSGKKLNYIIADNRHIWIQIIAGEMTVNDITMNTGDGVAISEETQLSFAAIKNTEFLLFDLI